jgi:hypothetical protein
MRRRRLSLINHLNEKRKLSAQSPDFTQVNTCLGTGFDYQLAIVSDAIPVATIFLKTRISGSGNGTRPKRPSNRLII